MRRILLALATVIGLVVVLALAHLAFIEVGREVVTLRTPQPDGRWNETRLWIVDDDGASWLHSAGESWLGQFDGDPVVEVERNGETRAYRTHVVSGPHARIDDLLREKYGLADRWVRLLSPCDEDTIPVRLEPVVQ